MANPILHCLWIFWSLTSAWAKVYLRAVDRDRPPYRIPETEPNSQLAQSRAFFIFGDSLVDSGNNNFLATLARADMPPYGIDSPLHQPTGRFSNGYNIADLISLSIGSEPSMPYLHPNLHGNKLLVGANFASAGVGILNDTGKQFMNIIRILEQLKLFEQYKVRVSELIGADKSKKLVKGSLVLISLGGNDFVNNFYLLPVTARSRQFGLSAFVTLLIQKYRTILKRLYELGPRRIIVTGTGPLGCAPATLATWSLTGKCAIELQRATKLFNPQLVTMIKKLNHEIGSHVFVAANAHEMNMDFITNPRSFGFKTSKVACCGQGPFNGLGVCTPLSTVCNDRNNHVFWDAFHLTEKANRLIVHKIMTGTKELMHPFNLSTIIILDKRFSRA